MTPRPVAALLERLRNVPGAAYWGAVLLVAASLGLRFLLDPVLANQYGFTLFYPAVILSAYWWGGRPALFATALSIVTVCVFGRSTPSFALNGPAVVWLIFFLISSILLIHVLSSIRARFSDLAISHARVEALANGQAQLFRDHAQRTTDHLQLISAILQVRAREEDDPLAARVLSNAASRTLIISRAHRDYVGGEDRTIAFEAFARRLTDAAAERGGLEAAQVLITEGGLEVPVEQATALGLILLEYLTNLRVHAPGARLLVILEEHADERILLLTASGAQGVPAPRDATLVHAMTEQLGGSLKTLREADGYAIRLAFPATPQTPPKWDPLTFSLH